jgi:hypothetical protein
MQPFLAHILSGWLLALACVTAQGAESPIPEDQRRSVEQTFLTFPEWFLVHSPAEYAVLVKTRPAHDFPFISHTHQLWSSYASVIAEQMREKYPLNAGYHVMICVIATSTTIEYALRWVYENTLGRISWMTASGLTDEDRYGAVVAQDYVNFIRKEPWYLYDFWSKLQGLWSTTPAWGPDIIRKWERRYALSTEFLIKAAYAKLIEAATRTAYTPVLMTTQVVVDHAPSSIPANSNMKILHVLPDGRAVMELPRYFDFRIAASQLAQSGSKLVDIAGNSSVILVTVWTEDNANLQVDGARVLFEQPLITMPGHKRFGLVLPVSGLSDFLMTASQKGVTVEHVYDY